MNGRVKKAVCGLGLCAVAAVCLVPVLHRGGAGASLAASLPSSIYEAVSSSVPESVKEKIDDLIAKSETPSDSEVESIMEEAAAEEAESSSQLAEENASTGSDSTAASQPEKQPQAASSETAASSSSSAAASSPASSEAQKDSCDEQIEALIAQLYQQQDRYERELLETIRQAHVEYVSYPEEQRNLVLKVQVVLSKTSSLSKMEAECDAEVENICTQMTTILKANGRDTAIVNEVKKAYKDKKSELKQQLVSLTYSGGDGSGTAGHWLYDQLEN